MIPNSLAIGEQSYHEHSGKTKSWKKLRIEFQKLKKEVNRMIKIAALDGNQSRKISG